MAAKSPAKGKKAAKPAKGKSSKVAAAKAETATTKAKADRDAAKAAKAKAAEERRVARDAKRAERQAAAEAKAEAAANKPTGKPKLIQLGLLPSVGGQTDAELCYLPVAKLVVAEEGLPPSKKLIDSIQSVGVRTPIIVEDLDTEAGTFYVREGRRRTLAAQILGTMELPAIIQPVGTDASVSTEMERLIAHGLRDYNPMQELLAVEALTKKGATEAQIAASTGMPVQTIRKRLRLASLVPELRTAIDKGLLGINPAVEVARLPAKLQNKLLAKTRAGEKVKLSDVRKLYQARKAEAVQEDIPWGEFAPVEAAPIEAVADTVKLAGLVQSALAELGTGRPGAGTAAKVREFLLEIRAMLPDAPSENGTQSPVAAQDAPEANEADAEYGPIGLHDGTPVVGVDAQTETGELVYEPEDAPEGEEVEV